VKLVSYEVCRPIGTLEERKIFSQHLSKRETRSLTLSSVMKDWKKRELFPKIRADVRKVGWSMGGAASGLKKKTHKWNALPKADMSVSRSEKGVKQWKSGSREPRC